eukprot:6184304-Pleurochrysis_carterae.AAC.3
MRALSGAHKHTHTHQGTHPSQHSRSFGRMHRARLLPDPLPAIAAGHRPRGPLRPASQVPALAGGAVPRSPPPASDTDEAAR